MVSHGSRWLIGPHSPLLCSQEYRKRSKLISDELVEKQELIMTHIITVAIALIRLARSILGVKPGS